MVDNLRPDLIIEQVFRTEAPVVIESPLPPLYFGIHRQMEWRQEASNPAGSGFTGGQENDPYNFPDLVAGATVERETATNTVLRPHVFLQNTYGVAEVTPTYDWITSPPTFSLSATLSATFEIADGTTGDYSASSGRFVDTNADFIDDDVADGDKILIDGVESLLVAQVDPGPPIASGVISDDELNVTKIDKGGQTYSGSLSIADVNGDRTFADTTSPTPYNFTTAGVAIGDLVTVIGWDVLVTADGISYTADTGSGRTITSEYATFQTDGVQVFTTGTLGTPSTGGQIWIFNGADWIPTFTVDVITDEQTMTGSNTLVTTPWPPLASVGDDVAFEIYNYTGIDLTGATVYQGAAGSWATVGAIPTGPFTHADAGVDFTVLIGAPGPAAPGWYIAAHDTDGVRPVFVVNAVTNATTATVTNVDRTTPIAGAGGPVTWELWYDGGGTAVSSYLGATVSIEDGLSQRTLTLDPLSVIDFTAIVGLSAGDIIYDESSIALFTVVSVDGAKVLTIENITPGSPTPGWTTTTFGFAIADATNAANLEVKALVDDNTLRVRNLLSDPSTTTAYTNLYYTIKVGNTLNDTNYTIEKTLTGSNLTGTVLSTYMARRNDYTGPVEVTDSNREATVGPAVPDNPLGLACYIALLNSNYSVWAQQVEDDTSASWIGALELAKSAIYYALCPLTQLETVLAAYRTHTIEQSEPEVKRERILFQSHEFERVTDRTAYQGSGDEGTIEKTQYVTEITFTRDLDPQGVIVGDLFSCTASVTGTTYAVSGRILGIVSGLATVITIVNDNGLPTAPPTINTTSSDWLITSKVLTDAEYAASIGAYPPTILNRRIRNVYPDSVEVTFTDETDPTNTSGFYGGGDVTAEVGGHFGAALETAKRGAQQPAQALSQFPGTGLHKLLNPFGDPYGGNEDLNDVVINGGNWVLSQQVDDGEVKAVRGISTDVSDIFKMEDSVTVQVDNFARLLRQQITPLLGRYNIDGPFFDLVSANVEAIIDLVVTVNKDAKQIVFKEIKEVEDHPDTFAMTFDFTPFVSAAKGEITIFI